MKATRLLHFFAALLRRPTRLLLFSAALVADPLHAQPLATPTPPPAALAQQLGAQLPLEMVLTDSQGRTVRLGDFFHDGRPVLLVLGYYRCPQLCGLLMHGVLEALNDSGVRRQDFRVVGVSIDPGDTPASANARRELDLDYAQFLQHGHSANGPLDLQLLVGAAADTSRLAQRVGFQFTPLSAEEQAGATSPSRFAHPAAVMIATPQGRLSRYLMGIQFSPAEMRQALADASRSRVGTLSDRIALLCAHFDPQWGRHSAAVMDGMRVLGVSLALALGAWCWRRRGAGGEPG